MFYNLWTYTNLTMPSIIMIVYSLLVKYVIKLFIYFIKAWG